MLRSMLVTILAVGVVAGASQEPADLVITGATVIDATGAPPARKTIVIRKGTIDALLPPGAPPPAAVSTLDATGRFAIPGLWDMHAHLTIRPEPSLAEDVMLPLFLAHGVVGVRDMGGPLDRVLALREAVAAGRLTGPRIITPGPFVDGPGDADPMFRRVTTTDEARAAVRDLVDARVDFIKVQAGLTRATYDAVMSEARARNAVVAGHVPIALAALDVVRAGQRSVEHVSPALVGDAGLLFGCSSREAELRRELLAIEHDRAGSPAAAIRAREAALREALVRSFDPARAAALGAEIRKQGAWIVPTLVFSNSLRPLRPEDDGEAVPLEYVPAATRAKWRDARARYLKAAGPEHFAAASAVADISARAVGALHRAGAPVLAGTDTFDAFVLPGVSLHQELAFLVAAGLSPLESLQAATSNAARFRGTSDREGTIAPGTRADLVLLAADPLADIHNVRTVQAVVQDGRLFDRAALDELLAKARTAANR